MYTLILTVIASGFLIVLGCVFLFGVGLALVRGQWGFLIFWIVTSPLFLIVGIRSMMQTVHFLRGGTYEGEWERWMFATPPEQPPSQTDWEEFRPHESSRP
jgi:hypothetical protein